MGSAFWFSTSSLGASWAAAARSARLALRVIMFGLSSYVLFTPRDESLREAPWAAEPVRHLLAQILAVIWWLQGARLVTVVLDRMVLPDTGTRSVCFRTCSVLWCFWPPRSARSRSCCNCRCAGCSPPRERLRWCWVSRSRAR